jgi:hypothetical protein
MVLGLAIVAGLLAVVLLAAYQYRGAVRPRKLWTARFPEATDTVPNAGRPPEPR